MGGFPKALLAYGGGTFLSHVVTAVSASGIRDIVVVLGHRASDIQGSVELPAHARYCVNPDFALGMTTSVQSGIRAVPEECAGVALCLVDQPTLRPETLRRLMAHCWEQPLVVPTFLGRRGHPLLIQRSLFSEVLSVPSEAAVNIVIRKDPERVCEVPLDQDVVVDVDTPEQFDLLTRSRPIP